MALIIVCIKCKDTWDAKYPTDDYIYEYDYCKKCWELQLKKEAELFKKMYGENK